MAGCRFKYGRTGDRAPDAVTARLPAKIAPDLSALARRKGKDEDCILGSQGLNNTDKTWHA